ncbi:two-component system, OmpR family, response regulator RegX3 [Actinobaculum suis]|uniref:Sensory transduction protein RegX3 n=1 Tax=Actinobaculum suis TaxID=1657 RepID=A0A0K9ETT8_9ACTO|nr:response regulator transcription factor [Actinobaculum suis]KMY23271.1 XRE family transcriptional regulator [Actinobaculum suis]MDY5153705.1 response regulator transcription factor [Actinobaculum suis]OCA95348.1 DNA-binding response regulator [Actinobaculum suis]OCA95933.1 DNA-binding response regulator [Actinobaculum suis]SDE62190.1 two-component system, OmpR family, response regulator RegX3 [Actinobaculum suis]
MTRILVVDDEPAYRDTLAFNLEREGYEVETASNGNAAMESVRARTPDLILLDLMLPGLSGEEIARRVRQESNVPIIMLTAKDSEIDKVVGLEVGADDYVTKPYSYRELLARVRAVLRRVEGGGPLEEEEEVLRVGRVEMDTEKHEVRVAGEEIQMPLREFELLELFIRNPDRVLTRSQILDRIWGVDYMGDSKTLDVHVKRIRSKIEEEPRNPKMLVTVRGLGYKLVSTD